MARFALKQRPPIVASTCLFALVVMLGPRPVAVPLEPEPMGPTPKCIVQGERHGELYLPPATASEMPTLVPLGHWNMPILPPLSGSIPTFDVDTVVSGLKRLLATPHT
jgi:hypothetical protein